MRATSLFVSLSTLPQMPIEHLC
jgi:hypothetical protein